MNWLTRLFTKGKKVKTRTRLTREEVKTCEEIMQTLNREYIMSRFNISKGTYYVIKKGSHRYSTREL